MARKNAGQVRGIVIVIVLAVLAGLSGWFLLSVENSLRVDRSQGDQAPGLLVDDYTATRLNPQGIRQYTLVSPHMVRLPARQGTRIEQPDITVFQEDGETRDWLIRAKRGWISADSQTIRLEDAVSITRLPNTRNRPVQIDTRNVVIYPNQDLMETTEAVHAVTPGGVLNGVGLKGHWHGEQLELLSEVRGTYVPPKP